ncbi:MAG: Mrp/NBP35 family ATP-binding protein [Bacteroidales bacterium]|nr:Mrp/NBP35 family ATP-binding protein [Bacteroidales bacterium]
MGIEANNIIEVLKTIVHPSAGKDIYSLGLVENLVVKENSVSFSLKFSTVNDPLKSSLKRACEIAIREKFGNDVNIDINIITAIKPVTPKKEQAEILPGVKNIVAIASGKGGVGKSTVATNLAIAFGNAGAKVGLIDADIFGPSIPKMFGVEYEKPTVQKISGKDMLIPVESYGVKILSIGFFIDPEDATVWRGPMASNALKQMLGDTDWGELDYLFVDLPPGTSDIHLTLVQTVPVTGSVIISTPQDVALADAIKGIKMFRTENIDVPVLGLIENMSWFTPEELPDNKYFIFGKGGCAELSKKLSIPLIGQIPIVQSIREGGDDGTPSVTRKDKVSETFKNIAEALRIEILKRNTQQAPTKKVEIKRKSFSDFK